VYAVAETLRISTDMIESPSSVISSAESRHLRGIAKQGDRLVILLDIDLVMNGKEAQSIIKSQQKHKQSPSKAA